MYVDTSPFDATAAAVRRHQRARGHVRLSFRRRAGANALYRMFQEGSAKVRLPRSFGGAPEAVLINTAGGLAGGDAFVTEIDLDPGVELVVTTQACERVYRSLGDSASVSTQARVASGGRLDWLPQETILFDGGRLSRRLEVDLATDAEFLALEAVLFGRTAMGETVREGLFRDRWRVRRDGRLVFADDLSFAGSIAEKLQSRAILGGAVAMATGLYVGPRCDAILEPLRDLIGDLGGVSTWDGKLLIRIAACDGLTLRSVLIPALSVLMNGRALPKVWQL